MGVDVEAVGQGQPHDHGVPLSVVIATREGPQAIAPVLQGLLSQLRAVGGEVVVACGSGDPAPDDLKPEVVWIATRDANILRLRQIAIQRCRGVVIAVGEDHAVPTDGWCEAVIRAHAERPGAAAVVGCLVNGTDDTVAGRANFMGFAAPFVPPMPVLPGRPPPVSTLSFKRSALVGVFDEPGDIESDLIPRLFAEGGLACDDRIVLTHHQDHGAWWSVANGFTNTRANYGYAAAGEDAVWRRQVLRWIVTRLATRQWKEVWEARASARRPADLVLAACICVSTTAGALMGTVAGPGRAADRVA